MKSWQLNMMRAGVTGLENGSRHAAALLRTGIDKLEERSADPGRHSTFREPPAPKLDADADKLDEVGEESFPASDPPASWS